MRVAFALALLIPCSFAQAQRPLDITPWEYGFHTGCGPEVRSWGLNSEGAAEDAAYAAVFQIHPDACAYPLYLERPWATVANPGFTNCDVPVPLMAPVGTLSYELANARTNDVHLNWLIKGECRTVNSTSYSVRRRRNVGCQLNSSFDSGTNQCTVPGVDRDKNNDSCPAGGNGSNPIHSKMLAKMQQEVDYTSPTSIFEFRRYYHSKSVWTEGALGMNWRHSYERRIYETSSGGLTATAVIRPNGDKFFFTHGANGARTPDPDVRIRLLVGRSETDPTGWRVVDENDAVETYDADGLWQGASDQKGHTLVATYSGGALATVTDEAGRVVQFQYQIVNYQLKLTALLLPGGERIRYAYRADVNQRPLEKVYFPSGSPATEADDLYKTYVYNSQLLLEGIVDERGIRSSTWGYDFWGNAILSYNGDATLYANRVQLTDIDGSRTQVVRYISPPVGGQPARFALGNFSFTVVNGVYKFASTDFICPSCNVTGVKSMTYDVGGFKDIVVDQRNYITDYDHDARGLETRRVEAAGIAPVADENLPEKRTIETDWHTSLRVPIERRTKNAANALVSMKRWTYNARAQVTAACEVDTDPSDPLAIAARNYTCGSSANAPTRVRQTRYFYCDAVNTADPDPIGGVGENLQKGCPRIGLLRRVDGPRVDAVDITTTEYRLTSDTGCATGGACNYRAGDVWKRVNALGHLVEAMSYDADGRLLREQDANGVITDLTYNQRGWLTHRTIRANANGSASSLDSVTTIDYDAHGNTTRRTDAAGASLDYVYDSANRLTEVRDETGGAIRYTLDGLGNKVKEEVFAGTSRLKLLARQTDSLGRIRSVVNAVDAEASNLDATGIRKVSLVLDDMGNITTSTDQLGRQTRKEYDARNRLAVETGDYGSGRINARTEFQYDALDSVTRAIDPKNLATDYVFDGLHDLIALQSPDTGTTVYAYNAAGNRTQRTDARGSSLSESYVYDALGRLTQSNYVNATQNLAIYYDTPTADCAAGETKTVGKRTRVTDPMGETTYCYDWRGFLLRKTQRTLAGLTNAELVTRYSYDAAGNVLTVVYPWNVGTVSYARDDNGRISGVSVNGGPLAAYVKYLPFGPANAIRFGSGVVTDPPSVSWSYDANYWATGTASSAVAQHFLLDDAGNPSALGVAPGVPTPTESYTYDRLNRLTDVIGPGATVVDAYSYDATGNRLSETHGTTTTSYGYPANSHRLTSVGSTARTYDAAGNTQSIGSQALTYDARGRLTTVGGLPYGQYNVDGQRVDAGSTAYAYDESGRLLQEALSYSQWTCPSGGGGEDLTDVGSFSKPGLGGPAAPIAGAKGGIQELCGGVEPPGCQGGSLPVCETTESIRSYVWADDKPIAMIDSATGLHYIHADQLGTPRAAVGATGSQVTWRWPLTGNAFGESLAQEDVDGDGASLKLVLRFPGQQFVGDGLHYNYFRDYEPSAGRYVESDPIGLRGGLSTYAYVSGSPLSRVDRFGLDDGFSPTPSCGAKCESTCKIVKITFEYPTRLAADRANESAQLGQSCACMLISGGIAYATGGTSFTVQLVSGAATSLACDKLVNPKPIYPGDRTEITVEVCQGPEGVTTKLLQATTIPGPSP